MSISLDGIKNLIGSIWKSLPTEIVVLLGFLIALSNMDFLPLPVLQVLGSTVSIASFAMLYFRMYNKVAHDLVISKAVRQAEKNYILNSYLNVRDEYIHKIKIKDSTLLDSAKEAVSSEKVEVNINLNTEAETEPEPAIEILSPAEVITVP